MPDRLTIINRALITTGNSPCSVPDDGSDEWRVASEGFERVMPVLLERHPWRFATKTFELPRLGDSDQPGFLHVYQQPADCLHIRAIYHAGMDAGSYRIVGGKVHTLVDPVQAFYVRTPGPEEWSATFTEAVTRYVEAYILRGLNEDHTEGTRREASAEAMLAEAKVVTDQQEQGRAMFRSRSLARRRGGFRTRGA